MDVGVSILYLRIRKRKYRVQPFPFRYKHLKKGGPTVTGDVEHPETKLQKVHSAGACPALLQP